MQKDIYNDVFTEGAIALGNNNVINEQNYFQAIIDSTPL